MTNIFNATKIWEKVKVKYFPILTLFWAHWKIVSKKFGDTLDKKNVILEGSILMKYVLSGKHHKTGWEPLR